MTNTIKADKTKHALFDISITSYEQNIRYNMEKEDEDLIYYCCKKCQGLWSCRKELLKHKATCSGNVATSKCDYFACDLQLFLRYQDAICERPLINVDCEQNTSVTSHIDRVDMINIKEEHHSVSEKSYAVPSTESACMTSSADLHNTTTEDIKQNGVDVSAINSTASGQRSPVSTGRAVRKRSRPKRFLHDDDNTAKLSKRAHPEEQEAETSPLDISSIIDSILSTDVVADATSKTNDCATPLTADVDCLTSNALKTSDEAISNMKNDTEDLQPLIVPRTLKSKQNIASRAEKLEQYAQYVVIRVDAGVSSSVYKCPTCGWETRHVGYFGRHLQTAHASGEGWTCKQCDFTCSEKKRWRQHMLQHDRPWLCDQCSSRFAGKRDLERHMWMHKGEFPYQCKQCDFKTRFPTALREHSRKHTGDHLRCDYPDCEFMTAYQFALTSHRAAKHGAGRELACSTCSYTTTDRGSLQKHERLHAGKRDYACSLCDYRAVSRHDVVRHQRSHTGEKCYFCDRCSYATAHASALRLHLMVHEGIRPWRCGLCTYSSVTRAKVVRHARHKHGVSDVSVVHVDVKLDIHTQNYRQRSDVAAPNDVTLVENGIANDMVVAEENAV